MTCSFPFCSRPVPKEGYCFLHAAKYGKDKPKPEPKLIPKTSEKRKKTNAEYSKLKKQMMFESNKCEAGLAGCDKVAVDLHHKAKRTPKNICDRNNLLRVCRPCHQKIEANPLMALELGFSKSKHKKQKTNILPKK